MLHLQQTVARLNREARVRAIVITGEGPKFFSAGADLNTFADGNREVARVAAARFGAAFEALQNARPVVIAAINGYAMGGGLECALACDIRIAEQHAVMALPETAVGLLSCGCGTQTLPWLVGEGWAKRMILTGERVDAATALRIGLVEEVVEKGAAREAALAMAARVATLSPQAVGFSKTLIHQARHGVPRLHWNANVSSICSTGPISAKASTLSSKNARRAGRSCRTPRPRTLRTLRTPRGPTMRKPNDERFTKRRARIYARSARRSTGRSRTRDSVSRGQPRRNHHAEPAGCAQCAVPRDDSRARGTARALPP
ncbi:MAG: Enoyl-CoA hydratase (EC =_ degradation of branched-chain amino acids and alpha-keto acids [uncultured Paraburkholderia sp.]|nr:MAG: Enoyl-CoA hydratase (EC => degradation of branched-chain amino acids and alpha-keto acids [uncultured Paraburkholderia sp.]CAH2912022.1 MAG: Enoyl-CoA hydratase (EC => degradation of branched-chain amino acids and alpha-keto acids [uncultured Paraburkholderia sp.]